MLNVRHVGIIDLHCEQCCQNVDLYLKLCTTAMLITYRYLNNDELFTRLSSVQTAKRTAERTVTRLKDKLKAMIEEEGIDLVEENASDIEDLVSITEEEKAKNHFRNIFWLQQHAYNSLHNKRRMRWHPQMIRFALNLYMSSGAYRAVGNSLALPSRRTLSDYTNVMTVESEINIEMIDRLKRDMNFDSCTSPEKLIGIMMDEMKVKSGLVFNRRTDRIVGFVNLGSINNDLEALQSSLVDEAAKQQPEVASSMLVLMIRLLRRPSFTFPVAQYPVSSLSGNKLYPIVWEVIEALELNGLKVMCISCDGLSANRKFFHNYWEGH